MKFYYYTHANYALDAIQRKELKLSHIHLANDPFELNWQSKDNAKMRDYAAITTGMLCFSKNNHNPLMWGHYSDNHKGICLCFEIDDKLLNEVLYIPDKKQLSQSIINHPTQPDKKMILPELPMVSLKKVYKSLDWKYEEEYRMYCEFKKSTQVNNDLYFISFKTAKIKLKEVILGLRCPVDYINIFRTVENIYGYKVKIYNTKISDAEFKVEINNQIDWEFTDSSHYNDNK